MYKIFVHIYPNGLWLIDLVLMLYQNKHIDIDIAIMLTITFNTIRNRFEVHGIFRFIES